MARGILGPVFFLGLILGMISWIGDTIYYRSFGYESQAVTSVDDIKRVMDKAQAHEEAPSTILHELQVNADDLGSMSNNVAVTVDAFLAAYYDPSRRWTPELQANGNAAIAAILDLNKRTTAN